MDVREFLRVRLAEQRLSMKEASERIGRNHAYLQQYFERGIPAVLPEQAREKLAELVGVDPDMLRGTAAPARPGRRPGYMPLPPINSTDRIPVMGVGEGGGEGKSQWNGEIVDYVTRPPALSGAPSGYATYVIGTSMEPRYHPGEMIFVHPGKPVNAGAYVLVQLKPPAEGEPPLALIKRLAKRTATKIVLEQFNPPKQLEFPVRDVVSIHRIVASGE
ncbi:MAG TPA: S24 family peptidase [Micropepsaceae bacterium]|nr:S24 family peptidase [Micropepsaceae bacterium]